jgi:D-tyrosyl-tRNA(Tyr) deacylase
MRVVVQRVSEASVTIDGQLHAAIGQGMLILLGIENADDSTDIEWLCNKLTQLRIFADAEGLMNKSINDIQGEILLISQFTLHAQTKKGNRPSFIAAAKPPVAIPLYEQFIKRMQAHCPNKVSTGVFGADMKVQLINDGPVTLIIDSKNRT